MTIREGASLFDKILDAGLADKSLRDFSFGDLKLLADLIAEHCDGTTVPTYDRVTKQLLIRFDAPLRFRYWQRDLSDKEKYDLFLEMGVPSEDMSRFMSERSIDVATGRTDKMGMPIKQES